MLTIPREVFLILNPSNGAVQVRLDCIKVELHSYYYSLARHSNARPPLTRIKDAKIDFELQIDIQIPMRVSWQNLDVEQSYGGAKSDESSVATYFRTVGS